MKKYIKKSVIALTSISFYLLNAGLAFAQDAPALFQPVGHPPGSKLTLVSNLPKGDWTSIIANVITIVLAITGSLAFAAFTYGGVMMITAQGNDEQIRKGKNILFWAILALAIIAASYAIVIGITNLKFFQ